MVNPSLSRLRVETVGGRTLVRFLDTSLHEDNVQLVGEELFAVAEAPGVHDVCLDFGNVEFLTSTLLGKVVGLNHKLRAAGGRLSLRNLSPQLYELFAVTHLNELLDVRPEAEGGPAG